MNHPILIAGAGPVGLAAALSLGRFGIPVRLIDKNSAATSLSKALVLWRRSLINLDPVIPLETWLALGLVPKGLRIHNQGAYKASLTLENAGHSIPPGLLVPQSDVEKTLIAALQKSGVSVERDTTLGAIQQCPDKVVCEINGPRGRETVETPYLFGCDGAHSTVRHALDLPFPGEAIARRWLLGDIEIEIAAGVNPNAPESERERTVDSGWIYSSSSDQGTLWFFPISDTRYRLIADAGEVTPDAPRIAPVADDLQRAINERSRLQWRITKTHWISEFLINERQVDNYVHGRVFLAGDAAHVHSPAGGQGMNTGIQDAVNLSWKVAFTRLGWASPDLIPTYQSERHPVAAHVLKLSGRATRMIMSTSRFKRGVQDLVMGTLTTIPEFRKAATSILAEDDIAYLDSSLVGESEGNATPGKALADLEIEIDGRKASTIELLRPTAPATALTLILMADAERSSWPAHPSIQVRQVSRDFHDPEARLANSLGLQSDSGLLVRPDAIIAAAGTPDHIAAWIRRWMPGWHLS